MLGEREREVCREKERGRYGGRKRENILPRLGKVAAKYLMEM